MNWRCDVYVYEDVYGGWTTHVAGRRRIFPPVPDILCSDFSLRLHHWSGYEWDRETRKGVYPSWWRGAVYGAWSRFVAFWHRWIHMGTLRLIPLRPIGLPYDGESFNDPTPGECADRLEQLRAIGYIVPQSAIDRLRAEMDPNLRAASA